MEKIHENVHVFVLSCKFQTWKHINMHISMQIDAYYYIETVKGLLRIRICLD